MKRAWAVVLFGLVAAIVLDVLYSAIQPWIPLLIAALVLLFVGNVWYRRKRWW